jgi:prophage regulatory protein
MSHTLGQHKTAEPTTFTSDTFNLTEQLQIIRLPQLISLIGLSRSMIYLKLNTTSRYFDQNFPKPIRIGKKAVGWMLVDVHRYVNQLKASSTGVMRGTKT